MSANILRGIVGRLLGLDAANNLIMRGTKIYYGDDDTGLAQGVVDLSNISPGGGTVVVSVTAAPGALQNNYAPAGYVAGTTNRLKLTAAIGGTTLTGILATGVPDGFELEIFNPSTTDTHTLTHQDAGSAAGNQFLGQGGGAMFIPPFGDAVLKYFKSAVGGVDYWVFT